MILLHILYYKICSIIMILQLLLNELDKIERDCLVLKQQQKLTEYGKGQLDLIMIIKEKINNYRYR